MLTATDDPVLIVGAGPVGLALACHLRRLEMPVRIVEKRGGPSVHSKAIGLQYRVSEILARLGIVDRFIARGGSPTTVNIYASGERLARIQFVAPVGLSGRDAFAPCAIVIPQSDTEAILLEHLEELGVSVEWGTEFVGYREDANRVTAVVQRGQATDDIRAAWLVSCEGAHSVVRKQSGISFLGKSYPLAFFMADVRMSGALPHAENHVWMHPDGSLAALPLPAPGTWRLFIEVTRQRDHVPAAVTLDQVRRYVAERAPEMDAEIIGEPLWLSDFRINCRMVDRFHAGRVFLAGDAAHIHSPTGGQGITTGLQDAANLAWKLARVSRGAPLALLDTYDEERLPHAAEVLRETDRTTRILFAPTRALRALRDWVVLPILRSPWVQQRMFGKLSQLHVHYRNSSLSRGSRRRLGRGVRPGDRAPDVAFGRGAAATRTTLFALMAPLRPLLLFSGIDNPSMLIRQMAELDIDAFVVTESVASTGGPGVLTDIHGDFAALYGLTSNFICLIRPDGYVGLLTGARDISQFRSYLARLCDPQKVREVFQD